MEARRDMQPFLIAALIMVVILHSMAAVARSYLAFTLATIRVVILGAIYTVKGPSGLSPAQLALLRDVPHDVRKAAKVLKLDTSFISFASCPKCSHIYFPNPDAPDDPYPHTCTHQETDQPVCGEPLVKEKVLKPAKKGGKVQMKF